MGYRNVEGGYSLFLKYQSLGWGLALILKVSGMVSVLQSVVQAYIGKIGPSRNAVASAVRNTGSEKYVNSQWTLMGL